MLTAIQASCTPLVFTHNHTPMDMVNSSPSQQALSPDSSPQQQQQQGQSCTLDNGGQGVDGSKVPPVASTPPGQVFSNQGHPQFIPLQQSFLAVGMSGTMGYTFLPSIMQQNSLPSVQPLSTISSIPRPTTVLPITAIPSSYYGRVQPELPQPPISFQMPLATSSADQQQANMSTIPSLTPVPSPAVAEAVSSPQQQLLYQQLHSLHTSGAGIRPVLNGIHRADFSPAPSLQSIPSPNIGGNAVGVHKMPVLSPPQSSTPSQSHSSLDRLSTPSSSATTISSSSSSSLSSDPELHRHHHQRIDQEREPRGRKRPAPHHDIDASLSYSKLRNSQQEARFSSTLVSSTSLSSTCTADKNSLLHEVRIKQEPMTEDTSTHHLPHSTRRNSDSNLEEAVSSSSKSYQINALIDVPPMAPALNRASRTSSLSSSLSSFRFGGSLSQLWASQISLGKINNMKSTG